MEMDMTPPTDDHTANQADVDEPYPVIEIVQLGGDRFILAKLDPKAPKDAQIVEYRVTVRPPEPDDPSPPMCGTYGPCTQHFA